MGSGWDLESGKDWPSWDNFFGILTTRIIFWLDKLSRTPGNDGEVRGEYVIKETL